MEEREESSPEALGVQSFLCGLMLFAGAVTFGVYVAATQSKVLWFYENWDLSMAAATQWFVSATPLWIYLAVGLSVATWGLLGSSVVKPRVAIPLHCALLFVVLLLTTVYSCAVIMPLGW
jgi:hypothetical protein